MPGFFIAIEGPDGSGTTRHSEHLAERLREQGRDVVLTFEPTDGTIGREVKRILKDGVYMEPGELQKMFCSDRAEHVERVIKPALDAGKIVITDRYIPSTLVYGEAANVSPVSLKRWNEGFPNPDLLLLLLPPFEVSFERLSRRTENDVFEKDRFQKRVYCGYEKYAKEHPDVVVIDTSKEKQIAGEEVWVAASTLLERS